MMAHPQWYSAKVRLVCLVEDEGAVQYQDTVLLFRAVSFREAFARALQLGREREEAYLNANRQQVIWRLKEILTLDFVSDTDLDGVEVCSDPTELEEDESYPFTAVFDPESSETTQTI